MKINETTRESFAEFLGTFILIVFGVGSVAQAVLSGAGESGKFSIHLAWGLAVTMGVYIAGGISGAHLNPAVTLALAVHRGFPWRKVLPYCLAQLLGAFVAAFVVYATYYEALANFDGGIRQISGPLATAGIWATYPQEFLSTFPGGVIDQVIGTALLMIVLFAITDGKNLSPKGNFGPVLVGATVLLIGMTFGFNSGYAINPARDFGPRIFTALSGWGWDVFKIANWWWVPIIAPCVGSVLGGYCYDLLITKHHPVEVLTKESS